ncbi:MAG: FAD:protein FMN transferase [Candidatus Woesearchaeota archaeon]
MNIETKQQEHLGTVWTLKIPHNFFFLFNECFTYLEEFEKKYSRFNKESYLSKINENLESWQTVDKETLELIQKGLYYQKKTKGHFSIFLKQRLEDLRYDAEYSFEIKKKIKTSKTKQNKLEKKNNTKNTNNTTIKNTYQKYYKFIHHTIIKKNIVINTKTKQIYLFKTFEIGGFGKGYAVDSLKDILNKHKVPTFFINAGGDIYAKGTWDVILENPFDTTKAFGKITLKDSAIACSSPNRRQWKGAHHLIDTQTKNPSHKLSALFVLAKTTSDADAYTTAFITAGLQKAKILSQTCDTKILAITPHQKIYVDPNIDKNSFEIYTT